MVRGRKEPDSRFDHGEWVILEGEETTARGGGDSETEQRQTGSGLLKCLAVAVTILLGVIAFASITIPILAQRPWVGISGREEILQGMTAGGAMKVRLALRNSGRTPASNLYVAAGLEIADAGAVPRVSECGRSSADSPSSVLFPGERYSRTIATRQPITDDTIAAVLRNDKVVYMVGCARYEDGIWWWHWQPRHTDFCRMFVPNSVGNLGLLGDFEDCLTGNSAD
jgi:hypothetical protein